MPSMTTLVAVRKPLEAVTMSNQPERRPGKRPKAPADDSSDDDFVFQPITKKPKTTDSEAARKSMSGRAVAKAMGLDEDSFTRQSTSSTSSSRRQTTRPQPAPAPERDSSPDFDVIRPGRASRGDGDSSYTESTTIALPTQDTPVINRNREMRKQAGTSRRSSLGSRGRRASLLMENGQVAIPHKEVDAAVFYKHIQAEGRTEPQRLRQLLMWCAERALPEKPRTGVHDYNAILGARYIQEQLLKEFSEKPEFYDWFSRDDSAPKKPLPLRPNPKNMELDEKMDELEERIKRLENEKQAWESMRKPPPTYAPVFATDDDPITLPDADLLAPSERKIRTYLASELEPFAAARKALDARFRKVQESLELEVDLLADNVHKLEQRVLAAGRDADKVLAASATRLKKREEKDKEAAGTRDMPMMEVLRSLGKILPEGS